MILAALKAYAEAAGLMEDPDYENKDVTRVLELAEDGRLLRVEDLRRPDAAKRLRAAKRRVPKTAVRSSGVAAQFLYDKSDYVFGVARAKDTGAWEATSPRLSGFFQLTRRALDATGDAGLRAVVAFLESQRARGDREAALPADFAENEWFVFRLAGDAGLVSDRPAVRAWWQSRRAQPAASGAVCLVTGDTCAAVDKHDVIKKVPGGSTSGVAIVTFNSAAFESYGFERNVNAPIGREAAEAYARALNRLFDASWPDPSAPGKTLPRRSARLSEDTAVAFWTADPAHEFADVFEAALARPDAAALARLRTIGADDREPFYALTVSGGQGRATIRDWYAGTAGEAARRLARFHEDLELDFSGDAAPPAALKDLLRSVSARGEEKNISASLAAETLRAVLLETPFPAGLLQAAVRRCWYEGAHGQADAGRQNRRHRSHLRAAALKAVLRRRRDAPELPAPGPGLDEGISHPAYLLGRLFAALEQLQDDAQGLTTAAIGIRYYGAASAAPASAFRTLLSLSHHHLAELRRKDPAAAAAAERVISGLLNAAAEPFPEAFGLEEQALFAVGCYQQRQALLKERRAEEAAA